LLFNHNVQYKIKNGDKKTGGSIAVDTKIRVREEKNQYKKKLSNEG